MLLLKQSIKNVCDSSSVLLPPCQISASVQISSEPLYHVAQLLSTGRLRILPGHESNTLYSTEVKVSAISFCFLVYLFITQTHSAQTCQKNLQDICGFSQKPFKSFRLLHSKLIISKRNTNAAQCFQIPLLNLRLKE